MRAQWLLAAPDAKGKLKVPRSANEHGEPIDGSSTNPSTWLTFDKACAHAERLGWGIGYCLSEHDPFACVDLDVKNHVNEPDDPKVWTTPAQHELFERIAFGFNCYTERSGSGQGVHIWCFAKLPGDGSGIKRDGVELYSQERFIACTGNVYIDAPIMDRQQFITNVATQMRKNKPPVHPLVEVDPVWDDDELIEAVLKQSNAAKIKPLWEGDWQNVPGEVYPSQSEADAALIAHFCFRSKSNEQVRRVFRKSGLGKRKKATKNDRYLNFTLSLVRSRQAEEDERRIENLLLTKPIGDGIVDSLVAPVMTVAEMCEHLVFIQDQQLIAWKHQPRRNYTVGGAAHVFAGSFEEVDDGGKKPKRVRCMPTWLASGKKRRDTETLTFNPRGDKFCHSPRGEHALNLYTPIEHAVPDDWRERVQPFIDHVNYLIPNATERDAFLMWLAHLAQRPGVLMHYAFLFYTPIRGLGRSWLGIVLTQIWRGYVALSVQMREVVERGYTGSLSMKLLAIVEELHLGNMREQRAAISNIQNMITEPERLINVKGGKQWYEFNACQWLCFTNFDDAIPIDDKDRRWYVVRNPDGKPHGDKHEANEAYFSKLYALQRDPLFIASVWKMLMETDLSKFNPGAPPPLNAAKLAVIDASTPAPSKTAQYLVGNWQADVITARDLVRHLYGDSPSKSEVQQAAHRAKEAHMVRWRGPGDSKDKRLHRLGSDIPDPIWILRNHSRWVNASDDEITAAINAGRKT